MEEGGYKNIWWMEGREPEPPRPVGEYAPLPKKPEPETKIEPAPWEMRPIGGGQMPELKPYEQPSTEPVPGGFWSGAGTGFSSAAKSAVGSKGWAAIALNDAVGGDPNNIPGQIAQAVASVGSDDKLAVGDYRKVHDWNALKTYLGEGVGQMGGSIAGYLAAMGVGAAAGSQVGPIGTATGAVIGAGANAVLDGVGQMHQALLEDPQIKKAIEEKKVSRQSLVPLSTVFGGGMGILDTAALARLSNITGIGEKAIFGAVTNAVKNSVKLRMLEGAVTEGGTEALQQTIQEIGRELGGGVVERSESVARVLNSMFYGIIGGAPVAALPGGHQAAPANKGATTLPPNAPVIPQPAMAPSPTGTPPGQGPAPPTPGSVPGSVPPPMQGPPPGAPGSGAYRPGQGAPPQGQYRGPRGAPPDLGTPPPNQPGQAPGTAPPPPEQPPGPGATTPSTPGGMGQAQSAPPGAQAANATDAYAKPNTSTVAAAEEDLAMRSVFEKLSALAQKAAGGAPIDTAAPISTATTTSMPGDDLALAMQHATQPTPSATGTQPVEGGAPVGPTGSAPPEAGLGPSTSSPGFGLLQQSSEAGLPGTPGVPGTLPTETQAQVPTPATPLGTRVNQLRQERPGTSWGDAVTAAEQERQAPIEPPSAALVTDVQPEPAPAPVAPLPAAVAEPPLKKGKAKIAEVKAKKAKAVEGPSARRSPLEELKAKLNRIGSKAATPAAAPTVQPRSKIAKPKVEKAKAVAAKRAAKKATTEPVKGKPYEPPPKSVQRPSLKQEARDLPAPKGQELNKEGKPIRRIYHGRKGPIEHLPKAGTKLAEEPARGYEPETGKAKGVAYVEHKGTTYAVPAGSWRQAMVKSFAKGSFQGAALLTADRAVAEVPDGTHVVNPGSMVRTDFQKEAQRVFREGRGQHKRALYERKESSRPFRPEKPAEGERTRRTVPANQLITGKTEIAQPTPEREQGPVTPVVPPPAPVQGKTTARKIQAEVQSRGAIFLEAMKALAHHSNYGERMQAVQDTVEQFRDRMLKAQHEPAQEVESAIRDTANDPTTPVWMRSEVGRLANQNLESILRQQREQTRQVETAKHTAGTRISQLREQEEARANKKLMLPTSPIWGGPLRRAPMREVIKYAKRTVARMGKDAPMLAREIVNAAARRDPVMNAKSGKALQVKTKLDLEIQGAQKLWANQMDARMEAHLETLGLKASDIPEPIDEAEAEAQKEAAKRGRPKVNEAERNAKAEKVIDKHFTDKAMKSGRTGWDWDAVTGAVKAAYQEAIKQGLKLGDVSPELFPKNENFLSHVAKLVLNEKGNVKRILGAPKRLEMMTEVVQSLAELRSDSDGTNFNEWIKLSTPTREEGAGKRGVEEETAFEETAAEVELPTSASPEEELIAKQAKEGLEAKRSDQRKGTPPPAGPAEGPWLRNTITGEKVQLSKKLTAFDNVSDHLSKRGFDLEGKWAHNAIFSFVDTAIRASLDRMVGSVRVVRVPSADFERLRGKSVDGYFQPPTAEERARGERGIILVDDNLTDERHRQIVMHEAIHAATHWAYQNNFNGTKQILDDLYRQAKKLAKESKRLQGEPIWDNAEEFLTWALSDPNAQEVLAGMKLEEGSSLETRLSRLKTGKFFPDLWRSLVAAVANALSHVGMGSQGMTYLDAVLRVYGAQAQDAQTSLAQGVKDLAKQERGLNRVIEMSDEGWPDTPRSSEDPAGTIFGLDAVKAGAVNAALGLNQAIDSVKQYDRLSTFRTHWLTTTMGMMRMSADMGMGPGHPFYEALRSFLQKQHTTDSLRSEGMKAAHALDRLARSPQFAQATDEAQKIMDEGTRANVDFRYPLSHPKNAWMRQGEGNLRHRLALADLHTRYNALPKDVKDVVDDIGQKYSFMQRDAVREATLSVLHATKQNFAGYGTSAENVADWVMGGGLNRLGTPFERPTDLTMAKTIPDYAVKKIFDAMDVNTMQGFYVPQTRRGDQVIRASRDYSSPKWLPKGATAIDEDTFYFNNQKDYEAYINANHARPADEQDHIRSVSVNKTSTNYRVRVQNQYFGMFDNASTAEAERQALIDSGRWENVTPVQHARGGIEKNEGMLPRHVQTAIENMEARGMKGGPLASAKAALIQTAVQSMAGNRMAHHNRIQRENVFGARAGEAVMAMRDYTFGYSNYVSGLRHNPGIDDNLKKFEDELRTNQMDPLIKKKQELLREMHKRVASIDGYNHIPALQNVTTLTYAAQLLSPAHVMLQLLQTVTSSWPHLAGQFGFAKATSLIFKAMYKIGVRSLISGTWSDLGVAVGDIGRALRNELPALDIQHADKIRNRLSGVDQRAFDAAVKMGLVDANAGQEHNVSALGKGRFENTNNAIANVVLSLTAGIEAMNRSVVLLAAVEGYMGKGLSEAQAIEKALHDVEQTQGNYAAANNPTPFQTPLGRVMFQFKKFALFTGGWLARQIYHSFGGAKNFVTGQKVTPEQRVQLRTLAWTLFAMGAMSGAGGAVPWEVVGLPLMVIQLLLGYKPTDPVDWMQEKTQQVMQYMGSTPEGSKKQAEIIMRGLPRLMNLDLQDRVGYANLASFGQPRGNSPDDMFAYLGRSIGGPFFGRSIEAMSFAGSEKSWLQFPFLPKFIKDLSKAYDAAAEGTFTKYNRRALEPYDAWETTVKAAGFSTGEEKRQWEPGGAARLKSEEKEETRGRSDLMGRWYREDRVGNIAARERVWKEIQDWNTGQPRERRIDRGNLYRLRQQRLLDEKKERRKYGEAAYG